MKINIFCTLLILLCTTLAHANEDIFTIDGTPLEIMCLSDDMDCRLKCIEHIKVLFDQDWENRDNPSMRNSMVVCYREELSTLRITAFKGYREILEVIEWLDTVDGKTKTAPQPELVKFSREFAARIEPACAAVRKVRQTGKMRWPCRLNPLIWRLGD